LVARSALVRPIARLEIFCRKVPEDASAASASLGNASATSATSAASTPASTEALLAVIKEVKAKSRRVKSRRLLVLAWIM